MRSLQLVPLKRNSPVHSVRDKGQATQNVFDRDNIDDRLWLRLIEELSSGVRNLPPPIWVPPAFGIVVKDVNHGTLHLTYLATVLPNVQFENQRYAAIPSIV